MTLQKTTATLLAIAASTIISVASAEEPGQQSDLENGLRSAEVAFARTMERRDHAGFVSFLAEGTVFLGSNGPLRGRDAVARAWKPLFEGQSAPFSWSPSEVVVSKSGNLGFSTGPVIAADGTSLGSFNSVWQRQADGSWKVLFDKGCPPCSQTP